MLPGDRQKVLQVRRFAQRPWHSPLHQHDGFSDQYLFTAACYNHKPVIGAREDRMANFAEALLDVFETTCSQTYAWTVLPNHYHVLAQTQDCLAVIKALGLLHGRTSFQWNGQDDERGRKVWSNCAETMMKSERHFWATVNYVHHNPVKHGYVKRWQDWEFTSAHQYLAAFGQEEAALIWKEYPVGEYGKGWDD